MPDAWLVFLTSDEPERICKLIETYPEFKQLYKDIYELCQSMEDIMGLFSKELLELEKPLYSLLSRNGRLEDLGRAVTDTNYRKQLLDEYKLSL